MALAVGSRSRFAEAPSVRDAYFTCDGNVVRMYGTRISCVFALWVIFGRSVEEAESRDVVISVPSTEDAAKAEGRYGAKYNDYLEVAAFKKLDGGRFDCCNFVSGSDVDSGNATGSKPVINKCCAWNYYFDVENLACFPLPENSTGSETFLAGIKGAEEESVDVVAGRVPDCGNHSVLTVRWAQGVSAGVGVAGEGSLRGCCVDRGPGLPPEGPPGAAVLACSDPASFCGTRGCFRKCCPLGYSYPSSGQKCQKSERPFKPKFYDLSTLQEAHSAKVSHFGIYLGDACGGKGKYLLERDLGEVSYLGLDGRLLAPAVQKRSFPEDEFCVEFVETGNGGSVESFLCFPKAGSYFENSQLQFVLLSLGFIISSMFLFLTFLVYLFSPKSQNLYGKTLMCYISSLCSAYLCLAVIELKSKDIEKGVCTSLGYSLLFSFLAAFFWLNVMSFDIWKTFRTDRSIDRSKTDKGKLQFLWYSLYAWGFPSAITAACACVNQIQDFPYEAVKPDIGEEHCWFSRKKKGIYLFFIAPISLVITLNVIFYVQTAWKIWKVKSDVKKMDRQKAKKFSANKEQFIINGKLFVVMGITWSLEIISFFTPHPIWYVTDAANALHGVFIFAIFVLKKKVLDKVCRQVRAQLRRMRQLTPSAPDGLPSRKNVSSSNAEGRTCGTGAVPGSNDSKESVSD